MSCVDSAEVSAIGNATQVAINVPRQVAGAMRMSRWRRVTTMALAKPIIMTMDSRLPTMPPPPKESIIMRPMPLSTTAMQIQERRPTGSRISSQPSRPAKNGAAAWMNMMLATVVYSSAKMKQLDATGAELTVTSCANCRQTFDDGQAHFKWDRTMGSLLELVAENLRD